MSGPVPLAGVIGNPVAHSLSPVLHQGWLRDLGLAGTYHAFAVAPADLEAALKRWVTSGFRGGNITIPHKLAVMSLIDEIDETARAIGAVNTLVIAAGRIRGSNTDAQGFIDHLTLEHPEWLQLVATRPALVLGAGGAARAVVYGLACAGIERILLANRDPARATKVAMDLSGLAKIEPVSWADRDAAAREAGLIVNATSAGMKGEPALEVDLERVSASPIVADLVYNPLDTALLMAARARGLKTLDGLGMLIHQARPAFKAWFGVDPPVDAAVRQRLVDSLAKD
jgi:shikimate dehydrogenase